MGQGCFARSTDGIGVCLHTRQYSLAALLETSPTPPHTGPYHSDTSSTPGYLSTLKPIQLTLAHSPDPDDVFMWWPITGMIDPPRDAQAIEPAHIISKPVLDTGDFSFAPIAADIAVLNRRALNPAPDAASLDITALSIFAWAHVAKTYRLTSFGSSMGMGFGPKIVSRIEPPGALPQAASPNPGVANRLVDRLRSSLSGPDVVLAIPGKQTTAFLLTTMMLDDLAPRLKTIELPFDQILAAVQRGDATHGLLIHQSQLTFASHNLHLVADVGAYWRHATSLPLPLGGNAVIRSLDDRFGPETSKRLAKLLSASIAHALRERATSIKYCMRFAPELSQEQAEKYIDMYVSDLTVDAGPGGERAIKLLLDAAAERGLISPIARLDLLRPELAS